MQMTLTVSYISKRENDLKMTDFSKYFKSNWFDFTLAKTVQQQQAFLQLIVAYPIVYFMCQPFLNIFRLNYFGTIYKFCLPEKAASLDLLISLTGFLQLLRAPLPNPFRGFGSSGVLTWFANLPIISNHCSLGHYFVQKLSEEPRKTSLD